VAIVSRVARRRWRIWLRVLILVGLVVAEAGVGVVFEGGLVVGFKLDDEGSGEVDTEGRHDFLESELEEFEVGKIKEITSVSSYGW